MYIAMNRFQVVKDRAEDFEKVWRERDSYLTEMDGFKGFHMLRGPERADYILYSSHTTWETHADFEAWTKSEGFAKAHANADTSAKGLFLGHPDFEGFEVIQ